MAGNARAIARLMTLAERGQPARALYGHAGRAHIAGVTGVPGSGKSTLVRALAGQARQRGLRVGVVAIDPSSPFSGGAILGDRIRMADLSTDDGVFIRSMASRGAMGGLSAAALDVVDVLDAAGFDLIMIETVGVGQDEIDIARAAHTVCVVSAPGMGDGVQAIKSGILEIADVHVVSKADKPEAQRTVSDLKEALSLGEHPAAGAWTPPVLASSADQGSGIGEVLDAILAHYAWLQSSAQLAVRVRAIAGRRLLKVVEDQVRNRLDLQQARAGDHVAQLVDRVARHELHPLQAAAEFLTND